MVEIEKCKDILNTEERQYSNEQILQIRAFLYQMAELEFEIYRKKRDEQAEKENTTLFKGTR